MFSRIGLRLSLCCLFWSQLAPAQNNPAQSMIPLVGNVRPEVQEADDLGAVPDSFPMEHMVLQLKPAPAQQAAFEQAVRQMHDPASPQFHHWLTAGQIGAQFGLPDENLLAVENWLTSNGLTVNAVYPNRTVLDFSGTAGQVYAAFHASIHQLRSQGEIHIANVNNPEVPLDLAPMVAGIVALHDFRPHSMIGPTRTVPDLTFTNGNASLGPGDLATVYNLNPLYDEGLSGQGQTIAVLESSDIYSAGDWLAYRRVFGLTKRFPQASLQTVHPTSGGFPCLDPGALFADREATLDAEVATAAAPNATILVAACANTFDFGGFIAMRNLLNAPNPPAVMSISYGNSETVLGPAENYSTYSLFLQAAAEGVSVFVSAGDWGGDGVYSDRGTASLHGLSVSGYASTPWNVAVGGTDFEDGFFRTTADYFSPTNTASLVSTRSYVPEIPWNGSCASQLFAAFNGFAHSYGDDGYCNSPTVLPQRLTGLTGSGGPSSCATGFPTTPGVVSGTCAGRPKPTWQIGLLGNPNDGVRDLPDVSLFASAGAWGHGYAICYSDPSRSGVPCTDYFQISGGTSASSPLMAGIQSLINQSTGQTWGNPNPVYYALARAEYGSAGDAACDASLGNQLNPECVFRDITQGDNVVICKPGSPNCFAPSGSYGVLSLSTSSFIPAYPATTGWDFATGIGSVNAYNLVHNWPRGLLPPL